MHLRSGKSIVSGNSKPSKVSTQGSGTGNNPRLTPIVEDSYLGETESTTSTSISMASYNEGMSEDMHRVRFDIPLFNTKLIHMRNNKRGAHLYVDPSNQVVVRLADIPVTPEPYAQAMFQGDRYLGTEGTIYLITPSYEDMDSHGVVLQTRASSEPPMNPRGLERTLDRPTRSFDYLPSAPPMPTHYSTPAEPEVSSHGYTISYVPVYRIMLDQNHIILYRNDMGVYYRTNMSPTQFYPFDNVINVHHNARGEPIKLEDDL